MHEATHRFLCRLAFLAICILPTFTTFGWIGYRRSSWAHTAIERRLSDELGLKATFSKAYNPRPGKYVLQNLKLHVVQQPAVTIPLIEAEEQGSVWRIRASQCDLSWAHRRRLWETLCERLAIAGNQPISVQIDTIQIDEPAIPNLTQFASHTKVDATGQRRSAAQFFLDGTSATQPMIVNLADPLHGEMEITFDGRDAEISSSLLTAIFPAARILGDEATFEQVYFQCRGGLSGPITIKGIANDISLSGLVNSHFAHTLTGNANLHLMNATLVNGKLQAAEGWLLGKHGTVSMSLVQDASQHLAVRPRTDLSTDRDFLTGFAELGIEFQLNSGILRLHGCCQKSQAPGAILADEQRALILEPSAEDALIPASGLIAALDAHQRVTVPATAEAAKLLEYLVVPAVAEEPKHEEFRR